MSGSSRVNAGSRKPAKAGGPSRSAAQPFDVAEDEYQAPFSLPVRQPAEIPSDRPYDLREDAVPSSPYFDERESAEAIAWARSDEAIDTADDEDGLEPIAIGSKTTRARRDSQVGSYDEQGSIFDGPTAGAVPSSISSMRHAMTRPELSHRTSSRSRRRISSESASHSPARSRTRADSQGHDDAYDASETASVRSSGRFSFARRETRRADADARDGDEAGTSYQPKGMLGNLLATFRGTEPEDEGSRRPGLGRRSSSGSVMSRGSRRSRARGRDGEEDDLADDQYDEEEVGRWSDEDYGASDDDDDDDDSADDRSLQSSEDGQSQSRGGLLPSAFGPLSGAVDPVFGDTRITTEHVPEDELDAQLGGHGSDDDLGTGFAGGAPGELGSASGIVGTGSNSAETDLTYLDKSARSRQQIYLPEEDALIRLTGYRTVPSRRLLYLIASWLTLGVVYLLARWLPRSRLRWICQETEFEEAEFIVIENQWGDLFMAAPKSIPFARPLATVFPATSREPPSTQAEFQAMAAMTTQSNNASKVASAKSSIRSGLTGKLNGNGSVVPPSQAGIATEQLMDLVYIDYRYTRFILHPPSGRLRMLKDWRDPLWSSVGAVFNGVTWDAEKDRSALFGSNVIDIAAKTSIALLVDEVLHPFYMFQLVSIALWSVDNYYYYAACIAIISAASITTTLVETKRTVERMRLMSRFSCDVVVLREGRWEKRDSSELVPGDVYDVAEPGLLLFPADSVLLTGDAIVNESMLTGESVPVSKVPVTEEALAALQTPGQEVPAELARHFLFAGTRIIRIRGGGLAPNVKAPPATLNGADGIQHEAGARAMVVRTGFDTTKGALVRSMLFPKPMGFKFYRDSFRFIGFLAGIAGLGFLASAINFVEIGIAWHTIVLRALDLVTVVVPPALPATMSIGTTFAIARLRKAGVFCISPNRVNIGGKVNVFCFDKTGTLTADGLDVLGSRTVDLRAKRFSELHESADEMPVGSSSKGADADARNLPLLYALATCHSLKVVDGEVIGDPLDVKMFEYTGWTLDEGREQAAKATTKSGTAKDGKSKLTDRPPALVQTVVRPPGGQTFEVQDAVKSGRHAHFLELGVLRTFEFASALRRMSVIVKRLKSSSMEVFVKGAPEVMVDICDPTTFPADYEDLLAYYTKHGYRVIACAGKSLPGLTWIKAQRMKREQAESGLRFLGLIIFENKLKEGTAPAIESLRAAHIVTKMVTGDNPRTAISVARECGMVGPSAHVFMPTFVEGTQKSPRAIIDWSSVDDERVKLDPFRLRPLEVDPHVFDFEELDFQDYQLALTGDVFRWMVDYAPLDTLRRMLIKGGIFARMSPDEKHELIERLQALGYTVGMCGDGANDCGALKAADLGISLSEAEASVAAPFTSSSPDISCVLEVIREGRAALVTSFSCFKYMALYSLIQFTSITILYSFASSLGDFQFLYIDLFIILPVAVAMARTLPVDDIHPKRPTANLVSKKVLISLIGQVIISSAVQIFVFFYTRAQPWYEPPDIDPDQLNVINPENSALFLVSSFQYILVAAVFSVGPPYRKPMYTNPMLMLSLGILSALSLYFLFVPSGFFFDILGLVSFPTSFHWVLFGSVLVNVACAFAFEAYATLPATKALKALQRTWRRYAKKDKDGGKSRKHDRKLYKVIADSEREQV